MKKLVIILLCIGLTVGCNGVEESAVKDSLTTVKVKAIHKEIKAKVLNNIGAMVGEDVKNLSFKSSGKIEKIYVKKGEKIYKGMELAKLDRTELQYSVDVSKAQMESAKAAYDKAKNGAQEEDIENARLDYEKARAAYEYILDNHSKILKLYENGAVSDADLKKVKLECDVKKSDMQQAEQIYEKLKNGVREEEILQAKSNYDMAVSNYKYNSSLIENAVLISDVDGYVVDILFKEGENVPAGQPIVVIRNDNGIVNIGVSPKDIHKVYVGNEAVVRIGEREFNGTVTCVPDAPDIDIGSYAVEVSFQGDGFKTGEIAEVEINIGQEEGIWIPIDTIMNDGDDFVYIVEEDRIKKRTLEISEIRGNMIKVKGLKDGDKVVIENANKVKAGEKVNVLF